MVKPFLLMFKILHCTKTCRLPLKPRKIPLFSLKRLCFTKRLRFTFVFVCFFPFPSSLFSFTDPYCYLGRQCFSISVSVLFLLHFCFLSKLARSTIPRWISEKDWYVLLWACSLLCNFVATPMRIWCSPLCANSKVPLKTSLLSKLMMLVAEVDFSRSLISLSVAMAVLLQLGWFCFFLFLSLFILFFRMHFNSCLGDI